MAAPTMCTCSQHRGEDANGFARDALSAVARGLLGGPGRDAFNAAVLDFVGRHTPP